MGVAESSVKERWSRAHRPRATLISRPLEGGVRTSATSSTRHHSQLHLHAPGSTPEGPEHPRPTTFCAELASSLITATARTS